MRVLSLDLGTKTGWAIYDSEVVSPSPQVTSGTWELMTARELRSQRKANRVRCCDARFITLHDRISMHMPVDWIYFEDVQFLTSQAQAQLWAGFRAMVTLFWRYHPVAVPVGTLKKFATGKGNAKKEAMAAAYYLKHPRHLANEAFKDDNEIDALHLLNYALCQINKSPSSQ